MTDSVSKGAVFVSGLAWSFIVLAALGIAIGLVQIVVFTFATAAIDVEVVIRDAREAGVIPDVLATLFHYLGWLLLASLALSAITFGVSLALLKRKNWARLVFIVLMWLAAAANLGGLWLQYRLLNDVSMRNFFSAVTSEAGMSADSAVQGAMIGSTLIALIFAALFAWAALRLASREVRIEFGR